MIIKSPSTNIKSIIKKIGSEKNIIIEGGGVLETLQDGFGFLYFFFVFLM